MASVSVPCDQQLPRELWGQLVRWRDGECTRCGTTEGQLHAHHIDLNPENNCLENGLTLCNSCHRSLHSFIQWHAFEALTGYPEPILKWFNERSEKEAQAWVQDEREAQV